MKYNILHLPFKVNIMTSQDYDVEDDVFIKEIKASLHVVCLLRPFRSYQIFTCPYHHNPLIKGSHILPHHKKNTIKTQILCPLAFYKRSASCFMLHYIIQPFFKCKINGQKGKHSIIVVQVEVQ